MRVVAVKAKRQVIATDGMVQQIDRELRSFAGDFQRTMADYPPQQPTVSGYVRTGDLGRGWRFRVARQRATVINRIRYGPRVQGLRRGGRRRDRQTREMRRRGWLAVDVGVRRIWPRHRNVLIRIVTQRDPRVQARRRRIR